MENKSHADRTDDYSAPVFDMKYFYHVRSIVGIWMLVLCVFGTPANALVMRCAWKLCKAKTATSLYNYFVLSMSAADFIFVSLVAPGIFSQYYLHLKYTRFWCTSMYVFSHCSTVSSSLSLLCLNLDKFIAIFRPLHHASIVTRHRVKAAVITCWFLSVSWSTFFIFGPALTYKEPCSLNVDSFGYYLIFTVCFFVMPTSVAAVLGCFIAFIAYRNEKQHTHFAVTAQSSTAGRRNAVFTQKTNVMNGNNNLVKTRARTFTFVFATTAWSCLTYLPYRIMYPIYISGSFQPWHIPIGFAFFCLMAMNPVGNPLITILTQRRYRIQLIRLWQSSFVCKLIKRTIRFRGNKTGKHESNGGTINGVVLSDSTNRSNGNGCHMKNASSEFEDFMS